MSPRYLSAERMIAAAGASFACGEDDAPACRATEGHGTLLRVLDWLLLVLRDRRFTAA
jgi:hypothetical protein